MTPTEKEPKKISRAFLKHVLKETRRSMDQLIKVTYQEGAQFGSAQTEREILEWIKEEKCHWSVNEMVTDKKTWLEYLEAQVKSSKKSG